MSLLMVPLRSPGGGAGRRPPSRLEGVPDSDYPRACLTTGRALRPGFNGEGDSATIARWIHATKTERTAAETRLREARGWQRPQLGQDEIAALVQRVTDLGSIIPNADAAEKRKLYEHLGLKMVYRPEREEVRVEIDFNPDSGSYRGVTGGVRGRTRTKSPYITLPLGEVPLNTAALVDEAED